MTQLDLLSEVHNAMPPFNPLSPMPLPDTAHLSDTSLPPKADGAYKTISEVSEALDVPQHVLRFWESNFPQVKPSRMRGSRRYYRPEDVHVLKTIKALLYNKGYTIKGAKKVMRDGKETMQAHVSTKSMTGSSRPVASALSPAKNAEKKEVDKKSLVSELRVLKSMLTSLL